MMMVTPPDVLRALFAAAVARAQPALALPPHLPEAPKGRTVVIGAGKASAAMACALEAAWPPDRLLSGVVVTRHGHVPHPLQRIKVLEAAHPVPDAQGQAAARAVLAAVQGLTSDDLVIALMSGGGSALLAAPLPSWTLAGEQALNRQLLACGASITAMNTVRRHLSALKGGRLARHCRPARLLTLAISDVPGDALHDIASGPTVPDPSTCEQTLSLIEQHRLTVPADLLAALRRGELETPKPGDAEWADDQARLIATPQDMLEAARQEAERLGWQAHILGDSLEGEAREVGTVLAGIARQVARHGQPMQAPCILLSGGETTVTLSSTGQTGAASTGGRNRELVLSAALALRGEPGVWMLAADTDGIDGSSDAAGALIGPDSLARAHALGLDAHAMLAQHRSGDFFQALGDQVVTGPTFTNVNDFRAVLVKP